jgi:hypothetical protein
VNGDSNTAARIARCSSSEGRLLRVDESGGRQRTKHHAALNAAGPSVLILGVRSCVSISEVLTRVRRRGISAQDVPVLGEGVELRQGDRLGGSGVA